MSYTQTIARNTFIQILGKATGFVFSVWTLGLLTRYFGPSQFGAYTTVLAFLQIFGIMIDFGLQMVTVQLISDPRRDENRVFSNIFTLRLLTSLLFFLAPLLALFFPYAQEVKTAIFIAVFSFIPVTLSTVLTGLYQKHLTMRTVAAADLINKALFFLLTWYVVVSGKNLLWIFYAMAAANILFFLILFFSSKKILRFCLAFEKEEWKNIFFASWPLALSIAFNLVYFKADTLILSLYRTPEEVGYYGAPYRILEVLINVSYLFLGLLLPLLAQTWAQNQKERFTHILQKGFDVMAIIAPPMVLGTLAAGKEIMALVAGEEYAPSGAILKILIAATAVIFFSAVFGYGIVAMGAQKKMLAFYAVNAAISILAYLYFIPKYSYWAAAWITLFSELFILAAAYFMVFRHAHFSPRVSVLAKSLCAAVIMALVILLFKNISFAFSMLAGGIAYAAIFVYILKGIDKKVILEIIKPNIG